MRDLSVSSNKDHLIFKWIHLTSVPLTSVVSQSWQEDASALGHRQMEKKKEKLIFSINATRPLIFFYIVILPILHLSKGGKKHVLETL